MTIVNFEHISHWFGVSIVDFEQMDVGWKSFVLKG